MQVSADEGASRSLLAKKKGQKNNQAAQAIDQSKLFSGGIKQAQAGETNWGSLNVTVEVHRRDESRTASLVKCDPSRCQNKERQMLRV
jgi:hypothetical protein